MWQIDRTSILQKAVLAAAGFLAVVIPSVLLREMLALFQGNELTLGLMLSHWLLGAALGSFLIYKVGGRLQWEAGKALALSFLAVTAGALLSFLFIRAFRTLFDLQPGAGILLRYILPGSFLAFFPCGMLSGFIINLVMAWRKDQCGKHACLSLAAGCLAAGILFTFLLLPCCTPVTTLLLCLAAGTVVAYCLTLEKTLRWVCRGLGAAILLLLPFSAQIDRWTLSFMYPGYSILESRDSSSSQLVVADRHGERYFFSDGITLVSFPGRDIVQTEEFGRLPLLFLQQPKRVLLIGGGTKYLPALFDRKIEKADYAESDPSLLPLLRKHLPQNLKGLLNDPRLAVHAVNGREFLAQSSEKYDALLIGLPYPFTLPLNRFYTREFFTLAKEKLTARGIIAFALPGASVYIDPALWEMNYILWDTVRNVFPFTDILPGENNIIVASCSPLASRADLKRRLAQNSSGALFLTPQYIDAKLKDERLSWVDEQLDKYKNKHSFNTDLFPRGMLASSIYRQSIFASRVTAAFRFAVKHSWIIVLLSLLWFLRNRAGISGTAFTSGAAAAGVQLLSIWGLQAVSGELYGFIGTLTAVFLSASAAGVWIGRTCLFKKDAADTLLLMEVVFCAWIAAWGVMLRVSPPSFPLFFLAPAGTGLLFGIELPLLLRAKAADATNAGAEKIYPAALAGGWLAALVGGTVLLPAWGIFRSLLFILLLKLVSLKWRLRFSLLRR